MADPADPRAPGQARGFFRRRLRGLIAHVKHEARLNEKQDDGSTYRSHLEAAVRQGRKGYAKKLQGPEVPAELTYLLGWFNELEWGRRVGQFGKEGFSWLDIKAWSELTGRRVAPQEVMALMRLDVASRFPGEEED